MGQGNYTEQMFARVRDSIPRLWWNLYQGALDQGFDQAQSFLLVQTWIMSQGPSGTSPPTTEGPPKEFGD